MKRASGRAWVCVVALAIGTPVFAALPGVTEFKGRPEAIADAELDALIGARVASADVVALGETIHGSSQLLRVQTRLIRYLVQKHGLRLIAWENPTLRSLELARWVESCRKAKSAPPLAVLYLPTASDAALWEWVCDFNLKHPADAIVFRGVDVWDRPWEHYARLNALASRVGAAAAAPLETIATSCPASKAASWTEVDVVVGRMQSDGTAFPASEFEACRAALSALLDAAKQSAFSVAKDRAHADDAFELALSASTLLGWLGFHHYQWSDDVLSWNARDLAQGRNLALVMQKHGMRRAIFAAHTSHTSHNRSRADWWGFGDIKSGVHFFAAATKKKVFNIAFTAYEGSGAQGAWSLPTARNSLDRKLHEAGHKFSFFLSDAAFLAEHTRWWMQNQNYPGAFESGVAIGPADHFDAFIFFDRSHLDRALPARPMWQP